MLQVLAGHGYQVEAEFAHEAIPIPEFGGVADLSQPDELAERAAARQLLDPRAYVSGRPLFHAQAGSRQRDLELCAPGHGALAVPGALERDDAGAPGTADAAGPALAQQGATGRVQIHVTQALRTAMRDAHLAEPPDAAHPVKDGPIGHQVARFDLFGHPVILSAMPGTAAARGEPIIARAGAARPERGSPGLRRRGRSCALPIWFLMGGRGLTACAIAFLDLPLLRG